MVESKAFDREFYQTYLRNELPDVVFDAHAHLWLKEYEGAGEPRPGTAAWVRGFFDRNRLSYPGLMDVYTDMFPGKAFKTLGFGMIESNTDVDANNRYVGEQVKNSKGALCGLALSRPEMDADTLLGQVEGNGLLGLKPYPNFAPLSVADADIRVTDMLTKDQLALANEKGWVVMLHIPRAGRLADPANIEDILMIERDFPRVRLIVAHIGRAYCMEDIGGAFGALKATKNLKFDIAGHTNEDVFLETLHAFGPGRILFGMDMPIGYMRLRREHKDGLYINRIPAGSCGDVAGDAHMREVSGKEAEDITFFAYESAASMVRAIHRAGLPQSATDMVFYRNAAEWICL